MRSSKRGTSRSALQAQSRTVRTIGIRPFKCDAYATIPIMLNYIWFGLMAIALVVAAFNGTADAVTKGAIDSAKTAVEIALGLIGIMTLWLGIMRIAEASGMV